MPKHVYRVPHFKVQSRRIRGRRWVLTKTAALVAGVASNTAIGTTTISMSATDATGGTAPYTYQWQRKPSGGAYSNVGGATSLTLNDTGLTEGTTYVYKLTYTDSAAATADSNEVTVRTWNAVNTTNWFFSPYNWYKSSGTYAITNTPGAYCKIEFSGTSLALKVDVSALSGAGVSASNYPTIAYSVDGAALTRYQLLSSDTSLTLATGLAAGTHTLELILVGSWWSTDRWTTPVMALKITGLALDNDASLSSPTTYTGRMVIYGDSVAEGYEALTHGVSVANQDAGQANGLLIARAFQCEVGVIGFAGQGFTTTGGGNVPDLEDSWDEYYNAQSRLSGGAFSPAPDYVISTMGQNDSSGVQTAVQNLITAWRTAAPSAKIVFCSPADLANASAISAGVTASGDANAFYVTTGEDLIGSWSSGASLRWSNANHLSVRGHARYAAIIAKEIQDAVGGGSSSVVIVPLGGIVR